MWLNFEEGDFIGFTYSNMAVVKYGNAGSTNYCRAEVGIALTELHLTFLIK